MDYYRAVWSPFIINELVRIRVERALHHGMERGVYRQRVNDLIHALSDVCQVVNHRRVSASGMLPDPDDEPILATAIAANASYVVSLNTRDFPTGNVAMGVRFVTPVDFLNELVAHGLHLDLERVAREAGRQIP